MIPQPGPSLESLLLQAVGILPLAALSFLLSRSIRRDSLRAFWQAWASLAAALFSFYLALRVPAARPALEPLYFLGEYVFATSILAGCQSLATGARPVRRWAWVALALAALATGRLPARFAVRLIPHTAIVAAILAGGARAALRAPHAGRGRIGTPLLRVALIALAALFGHYVPVLSWVAWTGNPMPGVYARYGPILQLLVETLLGFSTLIVVMEREHRDLEVANDELGTAREKLETMARFDPLTASLNRHAFYSMIESRRTTAEASGCVGVVDLDALKPINDTFGLFSGMAATRPRGRPAGPA